MLRAAVGGRRRGAGGHLDPGLASGTGSPSLIAACGGSPRRQLRTPHHPSSCGIRRRGWVPPNEHKRLAAAGQAPPGAGLYWLLLFPSAPLLRVLRARPRRKSVRRKRSAPAGAQRVAPGAPWASGRAGDAGGPAPPDGLPGRAALPAAAASRRPPPHGDRGCGCRGAALRPPPRAGRCAGGGRGAAAPLAGWAAPPGRGRLRAGPGRGVAEIGFGAGGQGSRQLRFLKFTESLSLGPGCIQRRWSTQTCSYASYALAHTYTQSSAHNP